MLVVIFFGSLFNLIVITEGMKCHSVANASWAKQRFH